MDNPFSRQKSLNFALRSRKDSIMALFAGSEWTVAPPEMDYEMGGGVYCTDRSGSSPLGADEGKLGCGFFRRTFTGTAVQMPDLLAAPAKNSAASRWKKKKAPEVYAEDVKPFCLILQNEWQKELYARYHRNGVFLDATHNTNK